VTHQAFALQFGKDSERRFEQSFGISIDEEDRSTGAHPSLG
jgi:hypothetical protein